MLAVEAERWLPPDPPSNALATERSQLLAAVRAATNEVLSRGLADGLRCDASAVRRLCFTLEVAGAHQLLPPFFALQPPGLWHALQQMQLRMRDAPPAWSEDASVRAMLEALALARDLADQHLWGHEAATALRDDYAARLWLCLALARRALSAWFGLIAEALPGAYADGALLRSAEDRDVLLALVAPLEHLAFELHGRPDSVAQFLSL